MEQAKKITGEVEIPQAIIKEVQKKVNNISAFKEKIEASLGKSVTEFLEIILAGAINLDASDIHIEPEETQTKFRIRVDGILQDIMFLELKIYRVLLKKSNSIIRYSN